MPGDGRCAGPGFSAWIASNPWIWCHGRFEDARLGDDWGLVKFWIEYDCRSGRLDVKIFRLVAGLGIDRGQFLGEGGHGEVRHGVSSPTS